MTDDAEKPVETAENAPRRRTRKKANTLTAEDLDAVEVNDEDLPF